MKKIIIVIGIYMCFSFNSQAQEPNFIGEIQMFAGNFAPRGWALCNGQLLAISQNEALFSIIGTIYGGDGRTTFALPDLRGRVVIQQGNGPGLSSYGLGHTGGIENVNLSISELPNHTHGVQTNATDPAKGKTTTNPAGAYWAQGGDYANTNNVQMSPTAVQLQNNGGSQAHNNIAPYNVVNYIIALEGTYPSRN